MRDLIISQWSRATCRRLGSLKIKLPTVRVWASADRAETLTWERLRDGAWSTCSPEELTSAELGEVRAYVRSDGLSADSRVEAMRVGVTGTVVTWREGARP